MNPPRDCPVCGDGAWGLCDKCQGVESLRTQLAASSAREARLREALGELLYWLEKGMFPTVRAARRRARKGRGGDMRRTHYMKNDALSFDVFVRPALCGWTYWKTVSDKPKHVTCKRCLKKLRPPRDTKKGNTP